MSSQGVSTEILDLSFGKEEVEEAVKEKKIFIGKSL
jgi:hypothetical protein